jgi:RpiR family transcriptional regulator, carbohydrate utilization regulator
MTTTGSGSIAANIRAGMAGLAPGEARVAAVLLDLGAEAIHHSVSDVASAAEVGVATVVRTCQTLGFSGFQAAKIALASDTRHAEADTVPTDVHRDDTASSILAKVAANNADAIRLSTASISPEDLERVVGMLVGARNVLVVAVGTSAPLAEDLAYRLNGVGIHADAPRDSHVQQVRARLLDPADVVVAISHTGATHETCAAAEAATEAGVPVVAVTSFTNTPLTELATVALVAGAREVLYQVEAVASRYAHLTVLDALVVAVTLARLDRSTRARELAADIIAKHRF